MSVHVSPHGVSDNSKAYEPTSGLVVAQFEVHKTWILRGNLVFSKFCYELDRCQATGVLRQQYEDRVGRHAGHSFADAP